MTVIWIITMDILRHDVYVVHVVNTRSSTDVYGLELTEQISWSAYPRKSIKLQPPGFGKVLLGET